MLPAAANLFNKNLSPPFVILPGDNVVLPNAVEMAHGALTPQKRATTEQHSNVPVAKRLQLINEASNDNNDDLFSGTTPPSHYSLDNNKNIFSNRSLNYEKMENSPSGDSTNNIAGTPAFITTLMQFIKFSDEQRQGSNNDKVNNNMAQQKQQKTTPSMALMSSSPVDAASANANAQQHPPSIWTSMADTYEGFKTPSSKLPSISNLYENNTMMSSSHSSWPSMNPIIPTNNNNAKHQREHLCASDMEDSVFDDDDCLLNNLPTSVDDLQDMEKQIKIKMERHFSSPLMSHRHTPSGYDTAVGGRLSAASGASFALLDGTFSAASNHHLEEEELDADDLEVAMINESFEEQQRQYKLYCGDKLKSAFYSAPEETSNYASPMEQEQPTIYPITVPENDDSSLYTNDSLYNHWKEESPPLHSSYDIITKPIVNDIFNNIIPCLDDDDNDSSEGMKSAIASLHPSIPDSMDSLKLYNNNNYSMRSSDISPPAPSFNSTTDEPYIDDPEEEDAAIATVLSSANFVLDEIDSPCLGDDCESQYTSPLYMKSPSPAMTTPPLEVTPDSGEDESDEDEAELVSAWKEIKQSNTSTGDNVRYYYPRNQATPLPPPLLDKVEEPTPPKNTKCLAHVTEIYDPNGELDTEPALQYFQSMGMKNFYQRDIDIQRAFLVFSNVKDAKYAVENNKTGLQLRLLEESPQFVKLKALKMYTELRPCSSSGYDNNHKLDGEPHVTEHIIPWHHTISEPIAGV